MPDMLGQAGGRPDPAQAGELPDSAQTRWRSGGRLLLLAALALLLSAPLWIWRAELAEVFAAREEITARVRAAGAWGPLVLIGLSIAQTIVAPIPGQALNAASGYLYGWANGLLYSWIGMALGSLLAMALARYAGRPVVERLAPSKTLARLDELVTRGGWRFFALVFLIPGLPDDLLCFAAGLTRLPLRGLAALSAVARIPGLFAAVWVGANAERTPWQVWAAAGALALVGFWVAWRYGERIQDAVLRRLK